MTDPLQPGNQPNSEHDPYRPAPPSPRTTPPRTMPPPGLLAIGLYLVLLAGVLILGVAQRYYPPLFLAFAAAFFTASAGLVLLFRWAWAGALAAVFLLSCYNGWIFAASHSGSALVQGLLNAVFFLYLMRAEVRERLH
ncbi:MAG TPA: hypothetical protein VE291_08230 [Terracidiphilus sp.]|jgi:hypothetical protein|nr:hypothetical protein [Terracidiphilus sp.]